MAIHVKKSGMMIGVKILEETESYWCIRAMDEKRRKYISKSDTKNKVFDGDNAVDDAHKWLEEVRK